MQINGYLKSRIKFALLLLIGQSFLWYSAFASNNKIKADTTITLKSKTIEIQFKNTVKTLWEYKVSKTNKTFAFAGPSFEMDGKVLNCNLTKIHKIGTPLLLKNGVTEYVIQGAYKDYPDLFLRITFRIPVTNPVVRFRFELIGSGDHLLTKSEGLDKINFLTFSFPGITKIDRKSVV